MTLKVLSWNIWIDGYFDQISEFLQKSNADIISLQEVRGDDTKRDVINFLKNLGYNYVFAPVEKTWGTAVSGGVPKVFRDGPAIFSKFSIINSGTYSLSKIDNRVAVKADIKVEDKILHVFSTHLIHTHQKESDVQKEQVENLIRNLPKENVIVMGDFNATPQSLVIKSMEKFFTNADPNLIPTWSVYPAGCLTCNPQKVDTVLDYIFISKNIKIESFRVEESKGSDHLPIEAIVEI